MLLLTSSLAIICINIVKSDKRYVSGKKTVFGLHILSYLIKCAINQLSCTLPSFLSALPWVYCGRPRNF